MTKTGIQIEGLKRNNIGDVFQALAAKDHLQQVDVVLDREALPNYKDIGDLVLIANGWYMHDYKNFPPPTNITPVYSSVHFSNTEILSTRQNRDHLRRHSPIGARDRKTLWMLRAANIPSYYSGCFTIGIRRRPPVKQSDDLLIVDGIDHPLGDDQIRVISTALKLPARRISHDPLETHLPFDEYAAASINHAETLLSTYCAAKLVVTTKIHCALPCLAMGVPVILIHPSPQEERLRAVGEYLPIIGMNQLDRLSRETSQQANYKRIRKRQSFVQLFLTEAVKFGGNPIARSPYFRFLKFRSAVETRIWHLGLRLLNRLGIQRERLGKVIGQLNPDCKQTF